MDGSRRYSNELEAYRSVAGIGAKPEEFMKMALDTTRMLLLRAEAALKAGERVEKAKALGSAGKITEFMLGLSGVYRGDLSDRLASVYQYVLAAILKGNSGDDAESVSAARIVIEQLAAVWRKVFPDAVASEG